MRTNCSRWRAHATAPLTLLLLVMLGGPSAQAEVRTITATGEFRLQGKYTTPEDAKRQAIQEATRLALEQTISYLQGMTEIKKLGVSKDDLRKYAAGLLEVTAEATRSDVEGGTTVVRADVKATIDTGKVVRRINAVLQSQSVGCALEVLWA